jgi:hypothetical protein
MSHKGQFVKHPSNLLNSGPTKVPAKRLRHDASKDALQQACTLYHRLRAPCRFVRWYEARVVTPEVDHRVPRSDRGGMHGGGAFKDHAAVQRVTFRVGQR